MQTKTVDEPKHSAGVASFVAGESLVTLHRWHHRKVGRVRASVDSSGKGQGAGKRYSDRGLIQVRVASRYGESLVPLVIGRIVEAIEMLSPEQLLGTEWLTFTAGLLLDAIPCANADELHDSVSFAIDTSKAQIVIIHLGAIVREVQQRLEAYHVGDMVGHPLEPWGNRPEVNTVDRLGTLADGELSFGGNTDAANSSDDEDED